ncbi:MAG: reverse transcriptase [Rhodomicrobium sp.]|nr:MAG: reverse transcriptase [Rhodomicrobium sp.]
MTFNLSATSIEMSIAHLCKYGDTDVFPHLHEIAFFKDKMTDIVSELSSLDLDNYTPDSAMKALAPKSRYGFRITHQLCAIDTLLLLSAVVEIGDLIEQHRLPADSIADFSYRFSPRDKGQLFPSDHTYKDWLLSQQSHVQNSLKIKKVVKTDISDFYARINFHRLENLLDEAAHNNGAMRYIKKSIKIIRDKQSFGLPVGGTAARILSELALSDTDKALLDHGISATRFVDDFRIFLQEGDDPYDVLSFLAQQLSINEGLALNASKTDVLLRASFLQTIKSQTSEISDEVEGEALDILTADIYFDDEPDIKDIEALKAINLLGLLQDEVGKEDYDIGRIKVIFRALKITRPREAIQYVAGNFSELVVFAKEVVLLMQSLNEEFDGCFTQLTESVITATLEPPAASVQLIRTWLLELFTRGIVEISKKQFKEIERLPSVLDKRQLHIIRSKNQDVHFFRLNKGNIGQMSRFEQPAFIAGASCLPKDEYNNWLNTLKQRFSGPTDHIFLKWVQSNKDKVITKISSTIDSSSD